MDKSMDNQNIDSNQELKTTDYETTPSGGDVPTPIFPRNTQNMNIPSSLFSHDDFVKIKKLRSNLEVEVSVLESQIKTLTLEAQKAKAEKVPMVELMLLKAETRNKISKNQSLHTTELIDSFIETIKETKSFQAQITIYQQKIQEESSRRDNLIHQFQEASDCLNLSEMTFSLPSLSSTQFTPLNINKFDVERIYHNLKDTQNSQLHIGFPLKYSGSKEMEAALQLSRQTESEIHLRSLKTTSIHSQIQQYQKLVAESEAVIQQLTNDNAKKLYEKNQKEIQISQNDKNNSLYLDSQQVNYKNELQQLDYQIQDIRNKIDSFADSYDSVVESIEQLLNEERMFSLQNNYISDINSSAPNDINNNSESEEETDDDYDISLSNNELAKQEFELQQMKNGLLFEINSLKTQYKQLKSQIKKKEENKKQKILQLKSQVERKRNEINNMKNPIFPISPLGKNLVTLIDKIDNTISDMKSEFS